MSRIHDILAKAERDGTARRTQAPPSVISTGSAGAGSLAPNVQGSSALNPTSFAATSVAAPMAPVPIAPEPRVARAVAHPALVAALLPHSAEAEQFRGIRTRLTMREEMGPLRTIAITSPGAGEGKSITAANLALTMAQEPQRNVLLIDADLRESSIHALFGLDEAPGLSDVLAGEAMLDDALVYVPEHRLTLLPAGSTPPFPTELLGSIAMRRTLDVLRSRFDRIVLDLPGVMPLADVGTVAPLMDGVLMVVRTGVTQRPQLDEALSAFEENKVLGIILNDVA